MKKAFGVCPLRVQLTADGETVDEGCLSSGNPTNGFSKEPKMGSHSSTRGSPRPKRTQPEWNLQTGTAPSPPFSHSRQNEMSASRRQCDTCRRCCSGLQTLGSVVLPEDHLQKMHILWGNNISGELCDLRFDEGRGSGAAVNL